MEILALFSRFYDGRQSLNYLDVFVAKWSAASATYVWAQRAGGTSDDFASGLALSGTSLYLTGGFVGPAGFGTITLPGGSGATTSAGFVAKLSDSGSTGSFVWAQQLDGLNIAGVAVSGTSLYVAGNFEGTLSLGTTTLTSAGNTDTFVAKLTDTGTSAAFVWAQRAGGPINDYSDAVALNGTSIYVLGSFGGTAGFGSTQLTEAGNGDLFITKLTDSGSSAAYTWAQRAGGTDYEHPHALAVNGINVYLTGDFGSAAAGFGATTLANLRAGSSDIFVAKLVDAGATAAFAWAQRAGGSDYDGANAIAVRGNSVCIAGGFISVSAGFGSTTLTNTNASRTSDDLFVAKLTDAGTSASFAWAQQAGGAQDDDAFTLALTGTRVYVAGAVSRPAVFGSQTLPGSSTVRVALLASLADPTLTATRASQNSLRFSLAPNPAHTATVVQLPAVPGAASASLTLTDALGRVVRTAIVALPAAGLRHELELRDLVPGVYTLQVRSGSISGTQRLVVE